MAKLYRKVHPITGEFLYPDDNPHFYPSGVNPLEKNANFYLQPLYVYETDSDSDEPKEYARYTKELKWGSKVCSICSHKMRYHYGPNPCVDLDDNSSWAFIVPDEYLESDYEYEEVELSTEASIIFHKTL